MKIEIPDSRDPDSTMSVNFSDFVKLATLAKLLLEYFDPEKKCEIVMNYDPELKSVKFRRYT